MSQVAEKPVNVGRPPSIPYSAIGRKYTRQDPTIGEGCPCCGAPVEAARPLIDGDSRALIYKNKSVILRPVELKIASLLARRIPGTVTHDTIYAELWDPDLEPDDARNNVKVQIANLRVQLKPLGIEIVNVFCVGYRMVLA